MAIRVRMKKAEVKADAEHWITLHPNGKESTGTPALINGAGQIIGGAGGKLTGKVVQPKSKSVAKPGTEEQHAPAIWLGPAKPEQPGNGGAEEVPPQPPKEEPGPEAPKPEEEKGGLASDPKMRQLEAKVAEAKEILEKAGKMPAFMRKGLEEDIANRERELADYKREKGLGGAEQPAPAPTPTPEPAPAPAPVPEQPKPEPEPAPEPEPEPEKPAGKPLGKYEIAQYLHEKGIPGGVESAVIGRFNQLARAYWREHKTHEGFTMDSSEIDQIIEEETANFNERQKREAEAERQKAAKEAEAAQRRAEFKHVPYAPQKNAKAAGEWAVKNNYVDAADFGKLNVAVVNQQMESLSRHLEEFPELRKHFNFTGSMQGYLKKLHADHVDEVREALIRHNPELGLPENAERLEQNLKYHTRKKRKAPSNAWAFASSSNGKRGVSFNEKFGATAGMAELERGLNRSVETKFHPPGCNTVKSIMDHEFGHQLDFMLDLSKNPEVNAIREKIYDGAMKKLQQEVPSVMHGRKMQGYREEAMQEAVSGYAHKGNDPMAEFIAECWAEYLNNPEPRPTAKAIGDIVRKEYAKRYPKQ